MAHEMMFDILLYLVNHGKTSAKILAGYFDVSTKTIYRQTEKLSICGVPIYSTLGRNGGIDLLSTFTLGRGYLSNDERKAIHSLIEEFPLLSYDKKMLKQKLIPDVDDNTLPPVIIDNSVWQSNKKTNSIPDEILSCVFSKNALSILYKGEQRVISPYTIVLKANSYYLAGYCHTKKELRLFKIERIKNIERSNEDYINNTLTKDELIKRIQSSFDEIEITLLTDKNIDDLKEEYIVKSCKDADDKKILTITAYNTSDLVFSLLKYEDRIKILSPKWLKDSIISTLSKLQKVYY